MNSQGMGSSSPGSCLSVLTEWTPLGRSRLLNPSLCLSLQLPTLVWLFFLHPSQEAASALRVFNRCLHISPRGKNLTLNLVVYNDTYGIQNDVTASSCSPMVTLERHYFKKKKKTVCISLVSIVSPFEYMARGTALCFLKGLGNTNWVRPSLSLCLLFGLSYWKMAATTQRLNYFLKK